MRKKVFVACGLCLIALVSIGCTRTLMVNPSTHRLEAPLLSFGPAQKIVSLDEEVMQPALHLDEAYLKLGVKTEAEWIRKALDQNKVYQECVQAIEVIRLNDAYVFFAKRYLKTQERFLNKALAVAVEADHDKQAKLNEELQQYFKLNVIDAKMAFSIARQQLGNKNIAQKLNNIEAVQLSKGMTYFQLRELLQLPGEHLPMIAVPQVDEQKAMELEPVLWVSGDQFLYVEFVNGKCVNWKLFKGLDFGHKADRKIRRQVEACDEQIVQPAWKLYSEYKDTKTKLAKQKIYNEAAAKQQQEWLEVAVPQIANYRNKLAALDKNLVGTESFFQQAELLLKLIEENLQSAQKLAQVDKNRQAVQQLLNRSNHLEHWDTWRVYYTYMNARLWLIDDRSTYVLCPRGTIKKNSQNPRAGSLMHWFKMPSERLHNHIELDVKNKKIKHRLDTHVWVAGDAYVYGVFMDDRLIKWQCRKINGGFYN